MKKVVIKRTSVRRRKTGCSCKGPGPLASNAKETRRQITCKNQVKVPNSPALKTVLK
jgi:hypothetical protein